MPSDTPDTPVPSVTTPGKAVATVPTQSLVQPPRRLAPLPRTIEAIKELVELGSDNPKMPEAYFIEFLRALYDPGLDKFNTSLWYRTFNTWRKSIDILDAAGNLLFVCPPVIGTLRTRLGNPSNQPSLAQSSDLAALEGKRHAMLEKKRMDESLAQYKATAAYDISEAWRKILERYGLVQSQSTMKSGLSPESLLSDDGDAL